jgi:hypothetical protein
MKGKCKICGVMWLPRKKWFQLGLIHKKKTFHLCEDCFNDLRKILSEWVI